MDNICSLHLTCLNWYRQVHDESLIKDPYDESSSQDAFPEESPDTKEDEDEVGFDEDERAEDALNQENSSVADDEDVEASSETDRYYAEESLKLRHSEASIFEPLPTSIHNEFSSKAVGGERVYESETGVDETETLKEVNFNHPFFLSGILVILK